MSTYIDLDILIHLIGWSQRRGSERRSEGRRNQIRGGTKEEDRLQHSRDSGCVSSRVGALEIKPCSEEFLHITGRLAWPLFVIYGWIILMYLLGDQLNKSQFNCSIHQAIYIAVFKSQTQSTILYKLLVSHSICTLKFYFNLLCWLLKSSTMTLILYSS